MTISKLFLGLGFLGLTLGCSSLPPPGVDNGRYIHPEYQISFEAPPAPPWFQSKDLPSRFVPKSQTWVCTMGAFSDSIFVNDARNGAIAVDATKTWQDLGVIPPQRIEAVIRKEMEKGAGIKAAPFVSNYEFKITAPYVCDIPLPLIRETFTIKNQGLPYRCEVRTYVYTVNKDDTRFLHFTLWSAPNTYKENQAALDHIVKTIQRIPQEPQKPVQ